MPPVFYFMLLTCWTCEYVKELLYSITEGIVIFQYIFCFCWQSSCTFEQVHVFLPGKCCCVSALQSWSYTVWSFGKNACDDNITPVMRHCRKLCGNGCGGEKSNFYWAWIPALVQMWRRPINKDGVYTENYLCLQQCCSEFLRNFHVSNI
jgi:hypothetical protein